MAKPHASIEAKLAEHFTQPSGYANSNRTYSDADVQQISSLLAYSNVAWSRAPRMYIILRLIDNLNLLDGLLESGFTDHWLPVAARTLPSSWGPNVKAKFLRIQPVVLTKSIDLEKGDEGKHRHFGQDEPLPFVVKTILGRGGSGQVDRVLSLISYKEYARKRIRRTHIFGDAKLNMRIYTNELETLKRLRHRHIVQLVGSYTDPVYLGLIMSPIADCDLAQFLSSVPSSPDKLPLLRSFFGCLASAITFLHLAEIRHMDLKPQNFLCKEDAILVTDFGLARDLMDLTQKTTVGTVLGMSPPYCSPEVAESEPRDYSADIWVSRMRLPGDAHSLEG
jgi:tRNA A-37 threonylcarbamoyl transferase component Bud32